MLTTLVKQKVEVPNEPGAWVEIRKVGWRKLQDASEKAGEAALEHVKRLGKDGLEAVKAVTSDQIRDFKANPAVQFDAGTLLRSAVIAWSYSDKPTPEELDELDEETKVWLVDQILALARPPRDEATVKNG